MSEFSPELVERVQRGLHKAQKTLPTMLLYDQKGSELFDRITEAEDYYPTRTEEGILRKHAPQLAEAVGPEALMVEYGSGSSIKTRILLDALQDLSGYVPVDISEEHLEAAAETLRQLYPTMEVLPVVADFTQSFDVPEPKAEVKTRACFFPGSTIGNFEPEAATALLAGMRQIVGPGGLVILGTDMVKDAEILERAYDDRQGVTAAFNLNILAHVNRGANANFDATQFRHRAVYDRTERRIEMQLVSLKAQQVMVQGERFELAEGEHIRTEYSHKHTPESVKVLAASAGFVVQSAHQDSNQWFTEWVLRATD